MLERMKGKTDKEGRVPHAQRPACRKSLVVRPFSAVCTAAKWIYSNFRRNVHFHVSIKIKQFAPRHFQLCSSTNVFWLDPGLTHALGILPLLQTPTSL